MFSKSTFATIAASSIDKQTGKYKTPSDTFGSSESMYLWIIIIYFAILTIYVLLEEKCTINGDWR